MPFTSSSERLLSIYLALGQYPILAGRIRARMRQELFTRGILNEEDFETEVRAKAVFSQELEGLASPLESETADIWEARVARIRDQLTDLHFSEHLTFPLFEQFVLDVLSERGISTSDHVLSVNPELAPQELVFEQAMTIEHLPPGEREKMEPRLKEAKVVLIRTLISDSLRYINIAKEWFTVGDLSEIRRRKLGSGRIGGKAAGMLLAARILDDLTGGTLNACIQTPESWFIGADEMYNFMSINNLVHWNDQKYKTEEQMRADFATIEQDYLNGSFPPDMLQHLQTLLAYVGKQPVIVRSSSLLEDNFGTSFAGKYDSFFCPNQGAPAENLRDLTIAIARIYASTLNPSALLYRRARGLQDYDERMALLVQVVRGVKYGHYFMPHAAGVAFSRNLYRWDPQIRREDGFLRLVFGLGTRAVDRVGNDYPRLIALSHPTLRPNNNPKSIARYSQQYVDLIDLRANQFRTLPVSEVLKADYPPLRYLAQAYDPDGFFLSLRSSVYDDSNGRLVLTFEELLRRTNFAEVMREMLARLEQNYHGPVDLEFTVHLANETADRQRPNICIDILQCRPQARLNDAVETPLPARLNQGELLFSTNFIVPQGCIDPVDTFLFVPPEAYFSLPDAASRARLARTVGMLNASLKGRGFVCVGPGRWGSSNSDLGVPIEYGDIYNTRALVEVTGSSVGIGIAPEPSLGTHFFQDLLESQIYPLAINLDDEHSVFNRAFFYDTPNRLDEIIQVDDLIRASLRVIRVSDFAPGCHARIVMSDEKSLAVAYLVKDKT